MDRKGTTSLTHRRAAKRTAWRVTLGGIVMALAVPISAYARTAPHVIAGSAHLSVSSHVLSAGGSISASTRANDPSGQLRYQYWLQNPSGAWHALGGYSASPQVTLSHLPVGSYLLAATTLDAMQVASRDWSQAVTSPSRAFFVGSSVSLSSSSTDTARGKTVTLRAQSTNVAGALYQFWVRLPNGTWMSSGRYRSSSQYQLTLSAMGRYQAVVYVKMPDAPASPQGALCSAPLQIVSYGAPSQLALTDKATTWVADGKDTNAVTLSVTDTAGDVVPTIIGSVQLSVQQPAAVVGSYWNSTNAWSPVSGPILVPLSHGVGQITFRSTTLFGNATIDAKSTVVPSSQSMEVSTVRPIASAVDISSQNTVMMANESGNPATFGLSVVDQAGFPMGSGTWPIGLTISGPGQFHDLTQGPDQITYTGGQGSTPLTVYSIAGGLGPMTLTARVAGLPTASSVVHAVLGGQPYQEALSAASLTVKAGSSTTVTLTQVTKTGGLSDPASLNNDGYLISATNKQGQAVGGLSINGMSLATPVTIPMAVGPNWFYAMQQNVTLSVGSNMVPGTYMLTVRDPLNILQPSKTLTITVVS